MIEQLREIFEKLVSGINTYKEVYTDEKVPDHDGAYGSIEATISVAYADDVIVFNWETEEASCSRGCCGYETHYHELRLPLECITDPVNWKMRERVKIELAKQKAKEEAEEKAKIENQKKLEAQEKQRLAKIEEEKATLAELKAKYES